MVVGPWICSLPNISISLQLPFFHSSCLSRCSHLNISPLPNITRVLASHHFPSTTQTQRRILSSSSLLSARWFWERGFAYLVEMGTQPYLSHSSGNTLFTQTIEHLTGVRRCWSHWLVYLAFRVYLS